MATCTWLAQQALLSKSVELKVTWVVEFVAKCDTVMEGTTSTTAQEREAQGDMKGKGFRVRVRSLAV